MLDRTSRNPSFGDLLRRARVAAGLTQEELAERAGLSSRGISDLERGARQTPRRDTLALLANALNLSEAERQHWQSARHLPGMDEGSPTQPTWLVGREQEFDILSDGLRRVISGRGRVVLISGEPGAGKTRLAEELSDDAHGLDVSTLWGRCYQGTGAPAYWPWIQVLRALLNQLGPDRMRQSMGTAGGDVAQLLPELHEPRPDDGLVWFAGETAQFQLFDSMTTSLRNIAADRPLMIILDDLQWADQSSLLLLEFLSRDIRESRMLVCGLYRDTEVEQDGPLASAIARINRQPSNQRLVLHGLSRSDVQSMIDQLGGMQSSPQLADRITERTAGNPFYVAEIAGYIRSSGLADTESADSASSFAIPSGVRELIRQRLNRLPDECREILEIASVIGREFDLRLLQDVSQFEAGQLLDLMEQAIQARIVHAPTGLMVNYRFVHDLTRDTVYDGLRPSRRIELHERVGLTLERRYESETASNSSRVAHHLVLAAPVIGHEPGVRYLIKAGDQAMTYVAYAAAAEHYGKAVEILEHHGELDGDPGAELLISQGEAQQRAGRIPSARKTFLRAAEIARRHKLPEHLARAALGFRGGIVLAGRDDPIAQQLLSEASQALGLQDSAMKAQCLARAALATTGSTDEEFQRRCELSTQAVEIARRVGEPEALATALHARHRDLWGIGDSELEAGMAVAAEMVEVARVAGNPELLFTGICWRMFEPLTLGDMSTVDRLFADCERLAADLRQPFYTFMITSLRAMRAIVAGRLNEAEQLVTQSHAIAQDLGVPQEYDVFWRWVLEFQLFRERDQIGEIEALAEANLSALTGDSLRNRIVNAQRVLARTCEVVDSRNSEPAIDRSVMRSEIDAALVEIKSGYKFGIQSHTTYALVHLAEAAAILDDTTNARRLYDMLEPRAGSVATVGGAFMLVGSVAHYCGLLSTTLSHWDDAERHFSEALAMNERIGAWPFAARTRYAWADMLLRRGAREDRERALELLAEADEAATEMGMVALARQITELQTHHFASASENPLFAADTIRTDAFDLTRREIEVLCLIAEGHSNRQIADALFISSRTVENHVSHILDKLDVSSRTAAARIAVEHGLTGA